MDNGRELIDALVQVSAEKGINKEVIFEAIEASLVSACKRHYGPTANVRVIIDRETGEYVVLATKTVVETVTDELAEISLGDARNINSIYEVGDTVDVKIKPGSFGRISAQTAKQVVVQKFREAERGILYEEFVGKQHTVVSGIVQRRDRRNVVISIGKLEAYLPPAEQMPREVYHFNARIRVYVLDVKSSSKGPIVNVSRTHPELLKYLFDQEVPEIADGVVEIKALAREAGMRSKVAVYTKNQNIDPIGACVGQNGQRVNTISTELRGEKIDIVAWSEDPASFIAAALGPSKVVDVAVNPFSQVAHVVVPDNQLSLAIGKEGQNARLAARLTGWRIDIKSETQAADTDFLIFPEVVEAAAASKAAIAEQQQKAEDEPVQEIDTTPEDNNEPAIASTAEETAEAQHVEPDNATVTDEEPAEPVANEGEYYDEYYDDEYYDDEYYDDEYYDEYYDEEDYAQDNNSQVAPEQSKEDK